MIFSCCPDMVLWASRVPSLLFTSRTVSWVSLRCAPSVPPGTGLSGVQVAAAISSLGTASAVGSLLGQGHALPRAAHIPGLVVTGISRSSISAHGSPPTAPHPAPLSPTLRGTVLMGCVSSRAPVS